MAAEDGAGNVKRQLAKVFERFLQATVPSEADVEPIISVGTGNFGDYQCNNAMSVFSKIKGKNTEFRNPRSVGKAIIRNLPESELIESCSVAGGFMNIVLSKSWLAKSIQNMLAEGMGAPKLPIKRVVVDFSSPNIAKEMHVGHLRSTIIGDTPGPYARVFGAEVLRRNHVGDWGTQFGMLIEFLFEQFPQWENENELPIKGLEGFYKQSKKRFDDDPEFKERAQKAVVSLQYIIELKSPSATAQLVSQFERNYAHLSMQKFSSHVVEKCSKFYEESHARIVYELLSVSHFEQLLQDPFANYVLESALEVIKGTLYESLVTVVHPHSMLRTNPYCKKIFS